MSHCHEAKGKQRPTTAIECRKKGAPRMQAATVNETHLMAQRMEHTAVTAESNVVPICQPRSSLSFFLYFGST